MFTFFRKSKCSRGHVECIFHKPAKHFVRKVRKLPPNSPRKAINFFKKLFFPGNTLLTGRMQFFQLCQNFYVPIRKLSAEGSEKIMNL